jgi:(S)-2-hydroxyglutarate dehydrogenase
VTAGVYDYCIVGGGIVGLATAYSLLMDEPEARVAVLEKEQALAQHQTGRNSGVIHSGVYYVPGSLKARLCKAGAEATKSFCHENGIPFEVCGKLVVATDDAELGRLEGLERRASENGIAFARVDAEELRRLEPQIVGTGALLVHDTGIVDYSRVCDGLATRIREAGGEIITGTTVAGIVESTHDVVISSRTKSWTARRLIVCAGLQSDRLARLAGLAITHHIVPFRGEYYALAPHLSGIVSRLIYPVPEPGMPFLGVHLTLMMRGGITVGPNAVLGCSREGYTKGSISATDVADFATFPGFWKMALRNWRPAVRELHSSLRKSAYLENCRKYCPSLTDDDLMPYGAGIRAQAVASDGSLIDDFLFLDTERSLHVCNAPSPAATSALPIGKMIADRIRSRPG